jgi:hypothetical protein
MVLVVTELPWQLLILFKKTACNGVRGDEKTVQGKLNRLIVVWVCKCSRRGGGVRQGKGKKNLTACEALC